VRRRDFIAGLGGAAWPLVARAQQPQRLRRVGVLVDTDENDPGGKAQLSGFTQGLEELGWTDGRNLRIDVRWGTANVDRMRMFAKELVDLQPGAGRDVVGISRGAVSGQLMVSDQAARSIG
jgi:putative tryptophan/tyrosine transport system substrate-binding protein